MTLTQQASRYIIYHRPSSAMAALQLLPRTTAISPHFSPGSREQAQDSGSKTLLWSEKRSHSYGLSEEQAFGHEDQPEPW